MFSWIRRLLGRSTIEARASHGGVAITGDNLGTIYTGSIVTIRAEEPSDGLLWEQCVAAATNVVRHASSRQLFNDTIVAINLVEVETKAGAMDRPEHVESSRIPLSEDRVIELIATGRNIVLSGEGGIGKTTAALQFAKSLLDEQPCRRLPIFVDAPAWSSTGSGPLEFVAALTDYAASQITPARLARYAKEGRLTLFIDGWNEIAADALEPALQRMRAFVVATPDVNIVLTTRNASHRPETAAPVLVSVAGVDWRRQQEYIRARLPTGEADALVAHLSVRHHLRHAARNPLILQGVVDLRAQDQAMTNSFMVYHAIVRTYESESSRSAALSAAPLYGLHRSHLEALAWRLNATGGTTLPLADARSVLADETEALQSRRQITGAVEPARLLQELCDHHLLFQEHGLVRFAHQRFQEYFAAGRYLSMLDNQRSDAIDSALLDPIDQPAWEDTLLLAAEKLFGDPPPSAARLALMRAAIAVDLHFACVLAAASGFDRRDGASTFDELVAAAGRVADATDPTIGEYGLACMIDSALPVFSDRLWRHLENQDQQQRLHFHRLGSNSISIRQLGSDAAGRLLEWDVERHAEFIHEIAGNPANWEYLVDCAFNATQDEVRVAAISAIRWEYPASDVALEAWVRAPDSVKLGGDLLGTLEEDLVDAEADVHAELRRLHATMPEDQRHRLALRFQPILPRPPAEYLLEFLQGDNNRYASKSVLAMLAESDPEKMDSLAIELTFSNPYPPDWAIERIRWLAPDIRAGLFDRALRDSPDESRASYGRGVVAECANLDQVSVVLREYLALHMEFLGRRWEFQSQDRMALT
ncbi:NACHT domain-containing protein [Luteimonas sp. XNQY3]|nr:NACHT domain-containing protein [Luteimonas sp. XNQY3]